MPFSKEQIVFLMKNHKYVAVVEKVLEEYKYNTNMKKSSVRSSVLKVFKDYKSITRLEKGDSKKQTLLEEFLKTVYEPPVTTVNRSHLPPIPDPAPHSSYQCELESYTKLSQSLAKEVSDVQKENNAIKNTKSYMTKKKFQKLRHKVSGLKKEVNCLERKNKNVNYRICKKRNEINCSRLKATYYQKQTFRLKNIINALERENEQLKASIEEVSDGFNTINTKFTESEQENDWLRETVDENIQTFDEDSNRYTGDLQQCVYSLLEHNVASGKISPVIKCVLTLANRKANKLPKRTTINEMNIQRLAIAQKQLEEQFSQEPNTCLLSDETSKYGRKYQGFHAADTSGKVWCLGVREMSTKAGETVLKTLNEILSDIDEVSAKSENEISKEILCNISSTMSDRAATQTKFNSLLEDFRSEVLQEKLGEQWVNFTDTEKHELTKLCNFFCSLHLLVHLAETASSSMLQYEKGVFEDGQTPIHDRRFLKTSEPGSTRLIRTSSKAFAYGGDEKSGCHGSFATFSREFLTDNKMKSVPLQRYRGNRFNILFSSASNVYFLADEMTKYLRISSDNQLLQAVKYDLQVAEYVAGCKALGLISELVTCPLWCLIENQSIHILDVGVYFKELETYLSNFDFHGFLEGKYLLSFVNKDLLSQSVVYNALLKEWTHDDKVIVILQIMVPALLQTTRRLLSDHLSGGKWDETTLNIRNKTLSTPKHNKFSESIFGLLDRMLKEKPNMSMIAAESYILFCHNKTMEWINDKPSKEKSELLSDARKQGKHLKLKFKQRSQAIQQERLDKLELERAKHERLERDRLQRLENMTTDILVWGLWQSENDVDQALQRLKTKKDQISSLTAQLRFRKNVLKQISSKDIYSFSKNENGETKKRTVDELAFNVKILINQACDRRPAEPDGAQPIIVGKRVQHLQVAEGEDVWFSGLVISQVPGYPDWFNIKYSGDPAIYTYMLMEDYRKKELKILP